MKYASFATRFVVAFVLVAITLTSAVVVPAARAAGSGYTCPGATMSFPVTLASGARLGWIYDEPPRGSIYDTRDNDGITPMHHSGIDIRVPIGTTVYGMGSGIITQVNNSTKYPNEHSMHIVYGGEDVYIAHLGLVNDKLKVGSHVSTTTVLGSSGEFNTLQHIHVSFGKKQGYNDTHIEDTTDPTPFLGADVDWTRRNAETPVSNTTQWIHSNWTLSQWCGGPYFSKSAASSALDLALVIDTTDSMTPYIDAVKSDASTIVNAIAAKGVNYRIALVDYKDFGDPYVARTDVPFTANQTAVISSINGLTTSGGGDFPEAEYSALIHAMNDPSIGGWRNGVTKEIIVMTDAYPHDPEPNTGYTLNSVIQAAQDLDPAIIQTIALGTDPDTATFASNIAAGTGGQEFTATSADDVVNAILDAINTIPVETEVTPDSLCTLSQQYGSNARVDRELCGALKLVRWAESAHSPAAKSRFVGMYIQIVNSLRGHGLTNEQADDLIRLAQAL